MEVEKPLRVGCLLQCSLMGRSEILDAWAWFEADCDFQIENKGSEIALDTLLESKS